MIDVATWMLVFARMGALLALFPLFAAQGIPVILRVALSALVAFLIAPMVPPVVLASPGFGGVFKLLFMEISVGLLLGFICRLVFFAIELGAGIIASEMGLAMSNEFNPLNQEMMPTPGVILYWLAVMLLFSLDMHHWLIAGFEQSYHLVPIGGAALSKGLYDDVIARTAHVFWVAVQMTAPILCCSFLITMVFSLLGRAVPQMNVFTESFPVKSLAGLFVFGMTATLMAQHISNYLRRLPGDLLRVAELINGA